MLKIKRNSVNGCLILVKNNKPVILSKKFDNLSLIFICFMPHIKQWIWYKFQKFCDKFEWNIWEVRGVPLGF